MPMYRTLIYCNRCKEYKGVETCVKCRKLFCCFCEPFALEDMMIAGPCDHRDSINEVVL